MPATEGLARRTSSASQQSQLDMDSAHDLLEFVLSPEMEASLGNVGLDFPTQVPAEMIAFGLPPEFDYLLAPTPAPAFNPTPSTISNPFECATVMPPAPTTTLSTGGTQEPLSSAFAAAYNPAAEQLRMASVTSQAQQLSTGLSPECSKQQNGHVSTQHNGIVHAGPQHNGIAHAANGLADLELSESLIISGGSANGSVGAVYGSRANPDHSGGVGNWSGQHGLLSQRSDTSGPASCSSLPGPQRHGSLPTTSRDGAKSDDADGDPKLTLSVTKKQARNRLAQQRFRQKTKNKVHDLEDQLRTMSDEMQRLRAKNAELESELQRVSRANRASVSDQGATSGYSGRQDDPAADYSPAMRQKLDAVFPANATINLSLRTSRKVALTHANLTHMSPIHVQKIYKKYINEIAKSLMEARDAPSSPAGLHVSALVMEVAMLAFCSTLLNPRTMRAMQAHILDEYSVLDRSHANYPEEAALCCAIEELLFLTEPQKRKILEARAAFLGTLKEITSERRTILIELQECLPDVRGIKQMGVEHMRMVHAMERLQRNMRAEHEAAAEYTVGFAMGILTTFQGAMTLMHSYPWCPDLLAFANHLARKLGEPEAHAIVGVAGPSCGQREIGLHSIVPNFRRPVPAVP